MLAETAYLFRHALLREAAYQLQMPGDRARLHGLAVAVIEEAGGGRPPEPTPLDAIVTANFVPHPTDAAAEDLAAHAHAAGDDARHRLYLRRAAENRDQRFQPATAARLWFQLAETLQGTARGTALRRGGGALVHAGLLKPAEPRLEEALALHRGQDHFEGLALAELGNLLRMTGRAANAATLFAEAVDRLHRAGNRVDELRTIESLGCAQMDLGNVAESERLLAKARALGVELGLESQLGSILMNLATLFMDTGRRAEAEKLYLEALPILRTLNDRRNEGIALSNLANLYRDDGRAGEAERLYAESLAIATDTGSRRNAGVLLGQRAALFLTLGQLERAEAGFLDSLAIHREVGNRRFEGIVRSQLANVHLDQRRFAEAEHGYAEAIAIHREVGNPRSEGASWGNLARLLAATGRTEESLRTYDTALELHARVGNRRFAGIHGCERALVLLAAWRVDEAREAWNKAAATLREIGDAHDLETALEDQREACAKAGVRPFSEES